MIVNKFIRLLIKKGKKYKAQKELQKTFFHIRKNLNQNPFLIFNLAINNATPSIEVHKIKKGNSVVIMPRISSKQRRQSLAIRWLLVQAKKRKEKYFFIKLEKTLIEASIGKGEVITKKLEIHRRAELNKNIIKL